MTEKNIAKINEIFDSIQGEGPYIGYRQIFIRFCGCNLLCDYCDTEYQKGEDYTVDGLIEKLNEYDLKHIHSISLTGGEPLIQYEFLKDFLPKFKKSVGCDVKIYLETNGTLYKPLEKVIDYVDIVSMDFKIDSSAKIGDIYKNHYEFLKVCEKAKKEVFAKLVFDDNIKSFEIDECIKLANQYGISLILQPKMFKNGVAVSHEKIVQIFDKFTEKYSDVRLIGQVHKFFDIR